MNFGKKKSKKIKNCLEFLFFLTYKKYSNNFSLFEQIRTKISSFNFFNYICLEI